MRAEIKPILIASPNLITSQKNVLNKWYIAYTFPKAEKKVQRKLELMGIECFLPLQMVIREWSDRKKKLEVPLFPNYIFVYTQGNERYEALQIKEIVKYVSFDGKPVTVPESLISSLDKMLKGNVLVSNDEYCAGTRIRVIDGPFCGAEGTLVRKNSKSRLVIQIKALGRSVSVDISSSAVVPCNDLSTNDVVNADARSSLTVSSI